ncbi:LysE family translocator [Cochlodiniinecator piscidefendens]|uniref:LysE family translocator n=1 Tax=Cochlodiniinecator piscidefendens TaxID=2715756 RepID=UPI00140BAA50|nr:LysE family translocator [Cochlodiniinecator piscidefendens]
MDFESWTIFALFWIVFVTTPGPNAVNCISNGMTYGFRHASWGIFAVMCQATLFLILSALGVTALLLASPTAFFWAKIIGAGFLIYLGIKGWINAGKVITARETKSKSIFWRSFMIAVINAKSVAGYMAAFSQFVRTDVPVWDQMWVIMPTALSISVLVYAGYTALGVWMGRMAFGMILHKQFRRVMAVCFVVYGVILGGTSAPQFSRS